MEGNQKKRQFDKAFKVSAVKMVEDGQKSAEVARSLGVHVNQIYSWKRKYTTGGEKAFIGKGNLTEIVRLRRELESARKDLEVLKKAVGIFSEKPERSTNS
jgi:transposase